MPVAMKAFSRTRCPPRYRKRENVAAGDRSESKTLARGGMWPAGCKMTSSRPLSAEKLHHVDGTTEGYATGSGPDRGPRGSNFNWISLEFDSVGEPDI